MEKPLNPPAPGEKTSSQTFSGTAPALGLFGTTVNGLGGFGSVYGWGFESAAVSALYGASTDRPAIPYSFPAQGGIVDGGVYPGRVGPIWPGTLANYRIMSAHPTIALTCAVLVAATLGTEWSFEEGDDAPPDAKDVIQKAIEPLRTQLILDCMRALAMGFSPFEIVYEVKKGFILPARCKYLLPDLSELLVDGKGNFVGIKQGDVKIGRGKGIVYTHDRESDNYYGRSRHENCRRAWSAWLTADDNRSRLGTIASAPVPHVSYPPGGGTDQYGNAKTNYQLAESIARGLSSGKPVIMPNLAGMKIDDIMAIPELAKASLWNIGTIDMGSAAPSQLALLEVMGYLDKLLVRGWLMPERSVLEAQKGGLGQGDSSSQGELGLTNADLVLGSIIRFVNESIINPLLEWNWGADAVGKVYAKAAPGDPEKVAFFRQLLLAVVANPQGLPEIIANINADQWFDATGLPKNAQTITFDKEALKAPVPPPADPKALDKQGNPTNGPKKQPPQR